MVIKNKYDMYIALAAYTICFPLSLAFYVLCFHLMPTDIPDYLKISILTTLIGLFIPIYPSVKLFEVIKRKIISIYKDVKKGALRLEFHNPPLSEQYPESYGNGRNKIMSDEEGSPNVSSSKELEIIENEIESSGELTLLMQNAISTQSAWGHYKATKHSRRKAENLAELQTVLDGFLEVAKTAVDISHKDVELQKNNINRKRIGEIENLKNDVEIAKLEAEKYEHEARISKSKQEISNIMNSPPPLTRKSREEVEADKREKTEAEADRREEVERGWRKELSEDQNFKNEDIEAEIERRKRARGWLDRL